MLLETHHTRCLAHAEKTPAEWCPLRNECARSVQIRHDTANDLANSIYLKRACREENDRFLAIVSVEN